MIKSGKQIIKGGNNGSSINKRSSIASSKQSKERSNSSKSKNSETNTYFKTQQRQINNRADRQSISPAISRSINPGTASVLVSHLLSLSKLPISVQHNNSSNSLLIRYASRRQYARQVSQPAIQVLGGFG